MICLLKMGHRAVAMVVVQTLFNLVTLLLNYYYCRRKIGYGSFSDVFAGVSPGSDRLFVLIFLNAIMVTAFTGVRAVCVGSHRRHPQSRGRFCRSDLPERYVLFVFDPISGVFLPKVTARSLPARRSRPYPICLFVSDVSSTSYWHMSCLLYSVGAAVYRVVGRRRVWTKLVIALGCFCFDPDSDDSESGNYDSSGEE